MYVSNHYSQLSPPKRDSAFGADPHAKRCHAAAVSDMPPSDHSNDVAVSSCPTAASATFPMRYWRQYRFHLMAAPSESIAQESDRPSGIVHCATTRCSSYRLLTLLRFCSSLPACHRDLLPSSHHANRRVRQTNWRATSDNIEPI
jgi:hypothetical protein